VCGAARRRRRPPRDVRSAEKGGVVEMAKRRRRSSGLCLYCGKRPATTRDHVIPTCLFPRPRPSNMITVPACQPCNDAKAACDGYFRDLCIVDLFYDPGDGVTRDVYDAVLRADRRGRSLVGRAARAHARQEPLYTRRGISLGRHSTLPVDEWRVTTLLSMIVRGLYYTCSGTRLRDDVVIEILRLDSLTINEFLADLAQYTPMGPLGIGTKVFSFMVLHGQEDASVTYWVLRFYGGIFYSVATTPPDYLTVNEGGQANHTAQTAS